MTLTKKISDSSEHTPLVTGVVAPATLVPAAPPLASDAKALVSAIIAFLGSAVLGLPFAFKQTGVALGLVILLFVAILTGFCILLLVNCKYKIQSRYGFTVTTYGDIGHAALGQVGRWIVDGSLVIAYTGFNVAYLIFISENASQYLGVSKFAVVATCTLPLMLFCMIRHLKQLAYIALIADVLNLSGLTVVYLTDFSIIGEVDHVADVNLLGIVSTIPYFFGVATYSFTGIGMALPLENAMQHKSHFKRIMLATIAFILFIYSSFGVCGYLAFGDETRDVITLNFEGHGGVATTVKLCMCAALFFSYPVILLPVFEVLQPAVISVTGRYVPSQVAIVLLRSSIVLLTALIAGGAPGFGRFISFAGSTCCSMLAFVLPAAFHLKLFADISSPAYNHLLLAISALGLLAVGAGFYSAMH